MKHASCDRAWHRLRWMRSAWLLALVVRPLSRPGKQGIKFGPRAAQDALQLTGLSCAEIKVGFVVAACIPARSARQSRPAARPFRWTLKGWRS
jgi:hypothetical protein